MAAVFAGNFTFGSTQTVPPTWPMKLRCNYEIRDDVRTTMKDSGFVTVDVNGPSETWGQTLTKVRAAITAKDNV